MTAKASSGHWEAMDAARIAAIVRNLAHFRYALRQFLRFSENAARKCGVTPQQHQLLLGVEGFSGRGSARVTELAEFLQERHHSVVGLVERAEQSGLVRRTQDAADRRVVNVTLTAKGKRILLRLTRRHYEETRRLRGLWGDVRALTQRARGAGSASRARRSARRPADVRTAQLSSKSAGRR